MERRVLLAVFLCFVVLYAYQALFVKTPPPRPKQAAQSESKPAEAAPAAESVAAAPKAQESAPTASAKPVASVVTVVGDPGERTITVDTRVVRAVFTNRGAELISWRLKRYLDEKKQPLELVPSGLPVGAPRPFSVWLEDAEATARVDEALFKPSATESTVDGTRGPVTLTFDFQDAGGLKVSKTFAFQPDSYVVQFDATASAGDRVFNPTMVWGPALGDVGAAGESNRYLQKPEGILFQNGSVSRLSAKQVATDPVREGDLRFAGVDDHYFVSAALPKGKMRVEYQAVSVPVAGQPGKTADFVSYSAKAAQATPGMRVFVGPKDFDVLKAADPQMVRIINFGFFAWLAVPLLRALKSINVYVGNYGWSIIILTILINAVMFPLRHKSMVSMRKLQALQPQIKAIQDRYAKLKTTDPARQKMNVEMMTLYREKGVNPASGCLPMLLTMPVLFAFYAMLGQAIEVRGAPFGLWIQDLSRHDPYYVTPILMGVTMLWQQKMTPSSMDPAQQKMMLLMPIMFTGFFLWAPSGLALYFLLSNLLAIGQQYVTNNMIAPAGKPSSSAQ
jgi:YidC/Oxa1 family membrane protein insertase